MCFTLLLTGPYTLLLTGPTCVYTLLLTGPTAQIIACDVFVSIVVSNLNKKKISFFELVEKRKLNAFLN